MTTSLATLGAAILVSSLAGSLHCVAMCGPLVGLHGGARSLRLAVVHALGRLTTYATLGALAGLVGRAVDVAGRLAAAQHVASIIAGAVIVAWGLRAMAVARGWWRVGAARTTLWQRGLVQIRGRRAVRRAWLIGVLTGLLPCGWLWAFVVSAAGTASALAGAAMMAVFWLGTVPAMTGVLALGGPLIDRLRRRLPAISAGVLIALGLATLAVRWHDAGATGVTAPSCHRGAP
jgi:sulfite exporter TauE/SafE